MKKLTFFLAALMVAFGVSAHTLNNPVGTDGRYIVKYDCEAGQFAAANDMEADETFVFAVDVKGTWLENWLKETPAAEGASRGVAINKWTSKGDVSGETNRMKQISGTIWGMTVNYAQIFSNPDVVAAEVLKKDTVLYIYAQLFGFEYTAENPGAGWWMWADQEVATTQADGSDCLFAFAPYTGTKSSPELYDDDYDDGDIYGFHVTGYAAPCVDLGEVEGTEYYMAGEAVGWNPTAAKFEKVEGVLTLSVEDFWGDFKITEGAWHPQYGAAVGVTTDSIKLNTPYVLTKCDDSEGEKDIENVHTALADNWRYKDAKFTLAVGDGGVLTLTLVAGTPYDHSVVPATYQIVGAFNEWNAGGAPSFEEKDGKLTVTVEDLNGTFKIIQDHGWANQWATNWENGGGLALGVPYELGPKTDAGEPKNLALANPFGGYKNAVLTLEVGEKMVLTLVSGDFYKSEADWYLPGTKLGWNCDNSTVFTPVEGKANTYELLAAEFGQDFKVVYGKWAVEFGRNADEDKWEVGKHYIMKYPAAGDGNFHPASDEIFNDVTITIVVDYEKVEVDLLIETETSGVENIVMDAKKAYKTIENGQIVIYKNGQKYNVLGTVVK